MDRSRRILHGGWLDNAISVFTRGWYGVSFDETVVVYGSIVGPLSVGSVVGPLAAGRTVGPIEAGTVTGAIETGRITGPKESR